MRIFLTGGTGFLGGHLAEACVERGFALRALVQDDCDTRHLEQLGAEIIPGDLCEQSKLRAGLESCQLLIHAAAKVSDWGSWHDFRTTNVEGARHLYEAAVAAGVGRAVHVSSTAVYGKELIQHGSVDETMGPLPAEQMPKWYYYGRSKSMAESVVREYQQSGTLQITIVRPGWVYGPGDHKVVGRLVKLIEQGKARCIGDGSNILMLTYVSNVVEAILLAATHEAAVGESFNVSNDGVVSQREYLNALADMLGADHVQKTIPYRTAYTVATCLESTHRLLGIKQRPIITRQSVSLMGLPHVFTTDKISQRLGWYPRVDLATAIENMREWWQSDQGS